MIEETINEIELVADDPEFRSKLRSILVSFGVAVMVDSTIRKEIQDYLDKPHGPDDCWPECLNCSSSGACTHQSEMKP